MTSRLVSLSGVSVSATRIGLGVALWAVALTVLAVAPAGAQAVDTATLDRLRQVIERQQAQIAAQARTLEALQGEVRALARSTRETAVAANEASRVAAEATQAAQAAAPEKTVTSGRKGVKLVISGQVNRGALFVDDGAKSHIFHVDNDNSSTRIRFIGEGRFNEDFKVGSQIEVEFESNSSAAVNQFSDRGVGPDDFNQRKLEVYLDSKTFGRLWIGQGDTASNGSTEIDLSGTKVAGFADVDSIAAGIIFNRSGLPQPLLIDPTVGATFNNLDGLSRDDRVRYDTPKWKGFQLSGSAIAGGRWDVAGRFSGKLADTKLAAVLSYWSLPGSEGVSGSFSALHASGLNATVAAGSRDFNAMGRLNSTFFYAKLGFLRNFLTPIGKTGLAVDYFQGEDQAANGDEGTVHGAYFVQNIDKIATQLYVGGRVFDLDRPGVAYDDILGILAGARVKF